MNVEGRRSSVTPSPTQGRLPVQVALGHPFGVCSVVYPRSEAQARGKMTVYANQWDEITDAKTDISRNSQTEYTVSKTSSNRKGR